MRTTSGNSEQTSIRSRQRRKLIMLMAAQLSSLHERTDLSVMSNRVVLLLNFLKAYDTVSREFLHTAHWSFHFEYNYAQLIRDFLVPDDITFLCWSWPIRHSSVAVWDPLNLSSSTIGLSRCGKLLSQANFQDPDIQGLPVPEIIEQKHIPSAFVDDFTLFLEQAQKLDPALCIVARLG